MSLKFYIYIIVIQLFIIANCANVSATVSEKTYLQTDRTVYVAGEMVFYKMNLVDDSTNRKSSLSKVGYILLRNINSNPVLKIRVEINAGVAIGSIILPDTLTSGAYQLVAYTNVERNLGEQHFNFNEIIIANRFDKELNFKIINPVVSTFSEIQQPILIPEIKTNKTIYQSREKVIVSLSKIKTNANVIVSVYEESPLASSDKFIFEVSKNHVDENKSTITGGNFLVENKGKIISGRIIDVTTLKSVPGVSVLLSIPDSVANLQYAKTNSDGIFRLLLRDYYEGKELFFTLKDVPEGQKWKIEMDDEFLLPNKWTPKFISNNNDIKAFIVKSENIVYINKSYQSNNFPIHEMETAKKAICPQVYSCHVNRTLSADFVSLKDFPEIVTELLNKVLLNKQNNKYTIKVINAAMSTPFQKDPAIFLDGVFVDDINKIIELGSDKIKMIEILPTERIFGDLVFQGIISITTKSNEILNTTPAFQSLRLKNDSFNNGVNIKNLNLDTITDKNIPYFKQLLYWNPNLELKENKETQFEFYTSDNTANFIIKVEGLSENGTPVSTNSIIHVINNNTSIDK